MREKILTIIKFAVFLILIPILIAASVSFLRQIAFIPGYLEKFFLFGLLSFLIMHLFLYSPKKIFDAGQRFIFDSFRFSPPLGRCIQMAVPFYTVIFLILLYFRSAILELGLLDLKSFAFEAGLVFLVGFTFTMHIVLIAQDLKEEHSSFLQAHYLVTMSFAFLAGLCILSVMIAFIYPKFLFSSFIKTTSFLARMIYSLSFDQLLAL